MKGIAQPRPSPAKRNTLSRRTSSPKPTVCKHVWKKPRTTAPQPSAEYCPTLAGHRTSAMPPPPNPQTSILKQHEFLYTPPVAHAEPRQTGLVIDQGNRVSNTSSRPSSLFFDPVNPTKSLFQASSKDGPPTSTRNANHVPGIRIPRVNTPPPERSWPPHKREKQGLDAHYQRQAVPAKLKVPKLLPSIKYPEFFEVGAVSQQVPTTAVLPQVKAADVPTTGDRASGLLHTHSQMIQDSENGPCLREKLLALCTAGNSAPDMFPVRDITKNWTREGTNSQDARKIASFHQDIDDQGLCKDTIGLNADLSIHTKVGITSERNINKALVSDLPQRDTPVNAHDCTAAATQESLEENGHQQTFLAPKTDAVWLEMNMPENQVEGTEKIDNSKTVQAQHGSHKPFGGKEKSPRRIADMNFSNVTGSAQGTPTIDKRGKYSAKMITDQLTTTQNNPLIFRTIPVSRQLFPKRQNAGSNVHPVAEQKPKDLGHTEVISEGNTPIGNTGAPSLNRLSTESTVADEVEVWKTMNLQESEMLTSREEEAVESIFGDLADLNREGAPDWDSIPEEFVDPKDIDWMRDDEERSSLDLIQPSLTNTALLTSAAEVQGQTHELEFQKPAMSMTYLEGTNVETQQILDGHTNKIGHPHSGQSRALPRVSHLGIGKKGAFKLTCSLCSKLFRSRGDLSRHLSGSHKNAVSNTCNYCKECFSCLCDSPATKKHHISCKRHRDFKACFHCKLMLPSLKHVSDHIAQQHPILSIPCKRAHRRVISQSGSSSVAKADKKKADFQCTVCHCWYGTKSGLKRHLMKQHMGKALFTGINELAKGTQ